jgi:leucine-rich repeat/coiled-coil domain-containing protein 1
MEGSQRELYLVNSGVRSLRDLALHRNLTAINLHSNAITKIENLELLRSLQHLDLSSNQIRRLEGLDSLVALRTLNVSCNDLQTVEGLGALKSLRKLDVSYNRISSLNGLKDMRGCSYRLSVLILHGNRIRTVDHVVECLSVCVGLRELTLIQDGKDNPVCRVVGYRKKILSGLEGLQLLDAVNRNGKTAIAEDDLDVIPGIDQYVEYLLSSSAAEVSVKCRIFI